MRRSLGPHARFLKHVFLRLCCEFAFRLMDLGGCVPNKGDAQLSLLPRMDLISWRVARCVETRGCLPL